MNRHVHLSGCDVAPGQDCTCEIRRYKRIAGLTLIIVAVQFVGSIVSGSLALLADTVHVALDFASALISVFVAYRVRNHHAPDQFRLRWMRFSGVLLLSALLLVAVEAISRLQHPYSVAGLEVVGVAAFGALMNYWQHTLVPHDHTHTSRAQRLHVLGDLFTSLVVIVGGALIWLTGKLWIDPILSLVVVGVVGALTIRMLRRKEWRAHTHAH